MSYHSSLKQRVYYGLPYPLKCAMATVYGAQQRRTRYGEGYRQTLRDLQASQRWDADRIREEEDRVLLPFLRHAADTTPHYREATVYSDCATREQFHRLPVLEKQTVQQELTAFYPDGFRREPHQWGHTSGTTGRALVFPISRSCFQREYAFRAFHYSWGGVDMAGREPMAFCSGHPVAFRDRSRPPFWTWDAANNWLLLSSYHLNRQNMKAYVRKLESFQPVMLGGYPSSLYLLALAYQRHGTGRLKIRAVFTASETLFDHQRQALREAFGVQVFNWYGNSEMCGHITQCEQGRLHVRHEHSLLEVLDDEDRPCGPGQTGQIVATGFHNAAFPLVRYRVGDEVTLSADQECGCGRTGVLVDRIEGRNEDYVVTPDGRLIGRLDHLFKDTLQVEEAQIQQDDPERVVLRIVRKAGYGESDERDILREARLRMGSDIRIDLDYVDEIPRTTSGKFRFVLSTLDPHEWIRSLAGDG